MDLQLLLLLLLLLYEVLFGSVLSDALLLLTPFISFEVGDGPARSVTGARSGGGLFFCYSIIDSRLTPCIDDSLTGASSSPELGFFPREYGTDMPSMA